MIRFLAQSIRNVRAKLEILKRALPLRIRREFFRAKIAGIYYLRKRPAKTCAFILCNSRTGSSLLINYLNSNPCAYFGTEILSHHDPSGIRRYLISKKSVFRHIHHSLNYGRRPISGAKIFFIHLQMRRISLRELESQFPHEKWIVLYRENILDQYLSYKIGFRTRQWIRTLSSNVQKLESAQVSLSIRSLLGFQRRILKRYESALEVPGIRERSLWISYEELVKNPQELFDEAVFPFLGLARNQVRTSLIKQNIWNYSEIISNYKEVKEFIKHSAFTQSYARYPGKSA